MRLLVIADVSGEEARHIGDEAMLEANLDAFRKLIPNVAFTIVSRDPAWTETRYGVDAVAPFGFPQPAAAGAARQAMLDRLLAGQQHATADAVAGADGVVVSGGGNLSSTWPDLLYERVALLQLARKFGKPSVVLGQTIGPRLNDEERRLLAETLCSARFVGVRELPSAALALELGIPMERLWYQADDALFLESETTLPQPTTIAVTIDPLVRQDEAVFGSLVAQLRQLSQTTGARLVLIPHAFGDDSIPSDLTEARVLAERLALPHTTIAAGLDAPKAKQITGAAALIISSRYHPIVFGLSAGVPSIGIYGDEYCRIKLQGALAHARLERWTLTYGDVARGELLTNALELWRARDDVRRALESCREGWRNESRERWAAVLRALDPTQTIPAAGTSTMFGRPIGDVAPALVSALESRRKAWEREQESLERELRLRRTIGGYASALRARLRTLFATRPSQRRKRPALRFGSDR